jgi:hypothetical protein
MLQNLAQPNQFNVNFRLMRGVGVFFLLSELVLAIFLYKERGTFMDVSFQTFEMIRTHALAPQVYRFGSALTQIYPFIGILLGLPLWMVAMLYSVGIIIYHGLVFYYCAFRRKSIRMMFVFILSSAMMTTHMFFWIQSEFSQALPFMIGLLCFLEEKQFNHFGLKQYSILIVGIVTLVFLHPLAFPVYTNCLLLIFAIKQNWDKRILGISWLMAFGVYLIKRAFFKNWYDEGAQERTQNFISLFPNYFNTDSTKLFLSNAFNIYIGVSISLLVLIIILVYRKNYVLLVVSIASILAYFFMINVTHPQADEFYLENMYLAIPLLIAIPLSSIYKLGEKQVVDKQLSGFLVCICLICIGRLWFVSGQYTERMNWFRTAMKKYEGQKMIISEKDAPMKQLLFSWPSAYECWMLSTIETGQTASLVIVDDIQKLIPYKDTTSAFIGIQIYRYQDLPSRYFIFKDTLTTYRIIE